MKLAKAIGKAFIESAWVWFLLGFWLGGNLHVTKGARTIWPPASPEGKP